MNKNLSPFSILNISIVLVLIAPAAFKLFANFPYYTYIDEGHILIWTEAFYAEEAPLRIFYGPLQFYLITFFDGIWYFFKTLSFLDTWDYLNSNTTPQFYNDFRSVNLLIIGRLISFVSLLAAVFFVYKIALNQTQSNIITAVATFYFASMAWLQSVGMYVQPEIMGIAILAGIIYYIDKRITDPHGDVNFNLTFKELLVLALLFALLASTKLYLILFTALPMILLYRTQSLFKFVKKAAFFYVTFSGLLLFLYYLYRTPAELVDMFEFAGGYYAKKKPGLTLTTLLINMKMTGLSELLIMLLFPFVLFSSWSLHQRTKILMFIFVLCFLYFSRYPFANERNLISFTLLAAFILIECLMFIRDRFPKKIVIGLIPGIGVLLMVFNYQTLQQSKLLMPYKTDSRTHIDVEDILNRAETLVIESQLQIIADSEKTEYIKEAVEFLANNPFEGYLFSSNLSVEEVHSECHMIGEYGAKKTVHPFFYTENPQFAVYACGKD